MTEPTESKKSSWGQAVGIHLSVVMVSLFLSILIAPLTVSFDPEGSGAIVTFFAVIFAHAVASIVSLFFPRPSKLSCMIVFFIAFFFTGCFSIEAIQKAIYMKNQAPYDRFRDEITSPVPGSVSNLHFLTMEEHVEPNLVLEFDIDPKDMDSILRKMGMVRKDPDKLLNPKDYFQLDYFMPIERDYHLYQQASYLDGQYVVTIKLTAKHDHAFFRSEFPRFYRDRDWEHRSEVVTKMRAEALQKLKERYARSQGKVAK